MVRSRHSPGLEAVERGSGPMAIRTSRRGGMADGGGHPADLAIPALAKDQPEPGGRDVLAEPDRHRTDRASRAPSSSSSRPRRAFVGPSLRRRTPPRRASRAVSSGTRLDLSQVGLGMLIARVGQAVGEGAVAGQEKQPLAVPVEPGRRGRRRGPGTKSFRVARRLRR